MIIDQYNENKNVNQICNYLDEQFVFQKDIEMKKPLFGYMGGKARLSCHIINYISDHEIYIEPFAGSLALLLAKGFKKVTNNARYKEVINDANGNLINLYSVIRDRPQKLIDIMDNLEYSVNNTNFERDIQKISNKVERAAYYLFRMLSAFGGGGSRDHGRGLAYGKKGSNNPLILQNKILLIKALSNRIKNAFIFNEDYKTVINRFDSKGAFIYLDPPYQGTRKYMSNDINYNEFADFVKSLKSKWLLSHYYDDFIKNNFNEYNIIYLNHQSSVNKDIQSRGMVPECIVMNYDYKNEKMYFDEDTLFD